MSPLDEAIIWLNLLGCTAAIVANVCAARVGFLVHRGLSSVIAVIGGMYVIGYALLLTGTIEVLKWSAFYRGVSVVVWPVVWAGPALVSLWAWHRTEAEIAAAIRGQEQERERSDHRG